jgi:hypothetical protein
MARLSLSQSPKFKVLVRSLGKPTPHVRGYLELLWESAHFRDDPFFASLDEIEAAADWQGETGVFGKALLDRNWIEAHNGGFMIHDYEEHLPSYVKERRRKADYRQSKRGLSQPKPVMSQDSLGTVAGQSDQEKGNERECKEKKENVKKTIPIPSVLTPDWADELAAKWVEKKQEEFRGYTGKVPHQAKALRTLLIRGYSIERLKSIMKAIQNDRREGFNYHDNVRSLTKLLDNWQKKNQTWIEAIIAELGI